MKKCPYCAEEVQSEAVLCKHCNKSLVPNDLVGKQKQEDDSKKKQSRRKGLLIFAGIWIALSTIGMIFDGGSESEDKKAQSSSQVTVNENKKLDGKTMLKNAIADIEKFNPDAFKGSVEKLSMEVAVFGVYASLINENKTSTDTETASLAIQLEKQLKTLQAREFPRIRREYTEVFAQKMWENNVYVGVVGSKSEILEITGAYFANNKNIKDTQTAISTMLTTLRFDQVRYRWYKGQDDFTYYDLTSSADNEIVSMEN